MVNAYPDDNINNNALHRYMYIMHPLPTLQFLNKALAMHISCLSPTEKFSPFSTTGACNFNGKLAIVSFRCALSKAIHTSSSVCM